MEARTRALVVSFDGLRPDRVSLELTPNLWRLKRLGVTLSQHRTIYPSETRTGFPSLVTGATTGEHGMVGNKYVDRSVVTKRYVDTSDAVLLRLLDVESWGKLMSVPSLGERLAQAGRSLAVLSTNTPGTTRLFHHKAEDFGHVRLSGYFREACTPADALAQIESKVGPLPRVPSTRAPDKAGQAWITSAFLEVVWPVHRPDVTILSYGEPDIASHFHGTGAPATNDILRYCDEQFGRLLDWWEAEGRSAGVQLMTVSDHGHISGHTPVSVIDSLRSAGFRAGSAPASDVDVVVVPGQVGALYLTQPDDAQISRLVAAISSEPWCGPIFTRARNDIEGVAPGSLGRHLIFGDHARAPDVAFAFRSDDTVDAFGLAGGTYYAGSLPSGLGVHGGLHPNEMSALGMMAGDAFAGAGKVSVIPTGICDIAPTLLHVLQVSQTTHFAGRVLHEVLAGSRSTEPEVRKATFEARLGNFRQRLTQVSVAGACYVTHGEAEGTHR